MDVKQMADEMNWECVFYILICEPSKGLVLKREIQKEICNKFLPVVGASCYGIVTGSDIRDAACLREKTKELFPEQVKIILIEPEKDTVSLLSPEERDVFVERLKSYEGDTVELAVSVCEEMENRSQHVEI